jgi:hypothetical protein
MLVKETNSHFKFLSIKFRINELRELSKKQNIVDQSCSQYLTVLLPAMFEVFKVDFNDGIP